MPEIINAAMEDLTIPIWAVAASAAVFMAALMLAVARAGTVAVIGTLFRLAVVIGVVGGGWLYFKQTERAERMAERRMFEERAAALVAGALAPGSALGCLDELAGDAVEAACERAVFASPGSVAAAVSYVTAELVLLADGSERVRQDGANVAASQVALRSALQQDRFGIVAHVLATRGCSPEKCDTLDWFDDAGHVLANLRDHTFDDHVTKYTALWSAAPRAAADPVAAPGAAGPPSLAAGAPREPAAAGVVPNPNYDFPSAASIPPVNIMVPEAVPAPRGGAGSGGQPAAAGARQTASPPAQQRRPPPKSPPPPPRPAASGQPAASPQPVNTTGP